MKRILYILIFLLPLTACEKLFMPDTEGSRPTEIFEYLWKTIDESYVYFEYRGVDWDSVYREFKPMISDTMTERQLFDTCDKMLKRLQDPNVILKNSFAESGYTDTQSYNANFNRYLLERNYWRGHEKTGPFIHTVIDSIGYVYYGDFDEEVTDAQLDIIIERLRLKNDSIEGVVFDIRDNAGGNINNAFTLLKRMGVDTSFTLTLTMYKAFYKNGPEWNDITEAQTIFLEQSTKTKFPREFILLTNRRTSGTAALFAAAATGYINVRVYGDTTGPATGRLVGSELPNGWMVQYPASYFKSDDDRFLEEGVIPNRRVDMARTDEDNGKDTILEEALKKIKEK